MRSITLISLTIVALAASLPAGAQAQEGLGERRYLDYYVSRYQPAGQAAQGSELDAVGGRLMWSLGSTLGGGSWRDRTLAGGYLTHTREEAEDTEVWRYGAQVDVRMTRPLLAGRVEPLLSMAVGAVHTREPGSQVRVSSLPLDVPTGRVPHSPMVLTRLPDREWTGLSMTPGLGARIQLMPGLNLRTDARQVIDVRDGVRKNVELSGGISVGW